MFFKYGAYDKSRKEKREVLKSENWLQHTHNSWVCHKGFHIRVCIWIGIGNASSCEELGTWERAPSEGATAEENENWERSPR